MINSNWNRWIHISVVKYMRTNCDAGNLKLFVEGEPKKPDDWIDWTELRMNGPRWRPGAKNEWECLIDINQFILSKVDNKEGHRLLKNIGLVTNMMAGQIPIFKYGSGSGDDQSFIECLHLKNTARDALKVSQLGRINEGTGMMRASIEGEYTAFLYYVAP